MHAISAKVMMMCIRMYLTARMWEYLEFWMTSFLAALTFAALSVTKQATFLAPMKSSCFMITPILHGKSDFWSSTYFVLDWAIFPNASCQKHKIILAYLQETPPCGFPKRDPEGQVSASLFQRGLQQIHTRTACGNWTIHPGIGWQKFLQPLGCGSVRQPWVLLPEVYGQQWPYDLHWQLCWKFQLTVRKLAKEALLLLVEQTWHTWQRIVGAEQLQESWQERAVNDIEGHPAADYEDHQGSIDVCKLSPANGLHWVHRAWEN